MAKREQKERKAYGAPGVLERTTHRLLLNIGVILFRSQCCSSASPYHIHPHDHAPIVILINSTAVTPQIIYCAVLFINHQFYGTCMPCLLAKFFQSFVLSKMTSFVLCFLKAGRFYGLMFQLCCRYSKQLLFCIITCICTLHQPTSHNPNLVSGYDVDWNWGS